MVQNDIDKCRQWQIRCPMTGAGGKGGYLQLFSSANDFTGGLSISGVVENDRPLARATGRRFPGTATALTRRS